jgi:hypothetical protein
MMSGNAQFRVVLKIWASAHTTLTAVIVRIGNEKSASRQEIKHRRNARLSVLTRLGELITSGLPVTRAHRDSDKANCFDLQP